MGGLGRSGDAGRLPDGALQGQDPRRGGGEGSGEQGEDGDDDEEGAATRHTGKDRTRPRQDNPAGKRSRTVGGRS